jgi:asparagine synthetase B (glutamine-hydrolysing)
MKINPSLTGDPTIFLDLKSQHTQFVPFRSSDFQIDTESIVEILRNAIPFTPNTTDKNLKMLSLGISGESDSDNFKFSYSFPIEQASNDHKPEPSLEEAVKSYHSLLCKSIESKTRECGTPYLLQSAGKDSTSLAIALAETRPGTDCVTYHGGDEENEVNSAKAIATKLGLKHHSITSNPTRAYNTYLSKIPNLKSITGDFAFLSYFDILGQIKLNSDSVIDGLGSDVYLGTPFSFYQKVAYFLANNYKVPDWLYQMPLINRNFKACYLLSTLELSKLERFFPGSRFSLPEIENLFDSKFKVSPNPRSNIFLSDYSNSRTLEEKRAIALSILEAGGAFAKGRLSTESFGMNVLYPFCNDEIARFMCSLPQKYKMNKETNKIIVRKHIEYYFKDLPYVKTKGSFRFNLVNFANTSFDQVFHFAELNQQTLPGAKNWLIKNKPHLDNKYFASKFYLLAIILPWLHFHQDK